MGPRALALLGAVLVLAACSAVSAPPERALTFDGPDDGALFNAETVEQLAFSAATEGDPDVAHVDDLVVLVDGEPVAGDEVELHDSASCQEPTDDDCRLRELVYRPTGLDDGEHTVAIGQLDQDADEDEDAEPEILHEWSFAIDTVPPELELTSPDGAVVAGDELVVAGTTEPGATVEVAGEATVAGEDGSFELVLASAPEGDLELLATDRAGNTSSDEVRLVTVPSRATVDEIRSVHVSFCAWATPSLREPILDKIEAGLINAVQLDLKDETGKVGHDTEVATASLVGADEPDCRVDLEAAIEQLHELGVPVIGRIVAFADPVLARWAWDNGERDWVIQTADGDMFVGKYAGFANFAHPEVIEYNVAVAEEAAAMGVDHILWDYLRKPDGPVEQFTFVGLDTSVEEAIVDFTRLADERIAPYGAQHGASLYGVSADRPTEVGQNVASLSEHLDYVAPMIYPSHWGPGEYDVDDPLMQPYDMVAATLEVWLEVTEGTRARVVPWLEDSNWPIRLGYPDRERYVREQIEATYDAGIDEWMLWDSSVRYTTSGMVQPSS